jgi:hypothetical protein
VACRRGKTDQDSVLGRSLICTFFVTRFQTSGMCLSLQSSSSMHPVMSVFWESPSSISDHFLRVVLIFQHISAVITLSSAKILWGQFSKNPHLPLMFHFSIFYPLTPILFIGIKFLIFFVVSRIGLLWFCELHRAMHW